MFDIGEEAIVGVVVRIASAQSNNIEAYGRLRCAVPSHVAPKPADLSISSTRPRELMWHPIFTDTKSHFYCARQRYTREITSTRSKARI